MEEENEDNIKPTYDNQTYIGKNLVKNLNEDKYSHIRGIEKLQRKIKKEITFLTETFESNKLKKEHLTCSNLHFYKAIVQELENQPDCEAVLEPFPYKLKSGGQKMLVVDLVSCKGQRWTKVIARNPSALHHIIKEGDSFGRRSIIDQANSYVQASADNLHMYSSPEVIFCFVNGVPEKMKIFLEKLGITVKGEVIRFEDTEIYSSDSESDDSDFNFDITSILPIKHKDLTRLNLCVTTMIAYVSSLTNGGCNFNFAEPILNEQAGWEKSCPVKPLLVDLFEGKELICCTTAAEGFKNIIDMVGGENEKQRAHSLLSRIKIVPDADFSGLRPSGKIKKRSLLIFGTGHAHQAITVTANKGFVLASKQKGAKFAAIIHESRALTERKQLLELSS